MSFLRDVDGAKEAVEAALEKYRMYMLTVPDEFLPRVTQTYSLMLPSNTNAFHSSTESAAIKKVDFERERYEYMERIRRAVNRLNKTERELIIKRYMSIDEPYDYEFTTKWGSANRSFTVSVRRRFINWLLLYELKCIKKSIRNGCFI